MVSEAVRRQLHDGDHVVQVPRFELRVDLVHIPGPEGTGAAVDEAEVGAPAVPQRGPPFAAGVPAQVRAGLAEGDGGFVLGAEAVADQPGDRSGLAAPLEDVAVEAAGRRSSGSRTVPLDVAVQPVGVEGVGVIFCTDA